MARRQLERLKNPLTGEIRLVSVYSREFNRLKKYGWLKASLGEWFQWLSLKRRIDDQARNGSQSQ